MEFLASIISVKEKKNIRRVDSLQKKLSKKLNISTHANRLIWKCHLAYLNSAKIYKLDLKKNLIGNLAMTSEYMLHLEIEQWQSELYYKDEIMHFK